MSSHILVVPADEDLIRSLQAQAMVVQLYDEFAVSHFARVIGEKNKVHCVVLKLEQPLSTWSAPEDLADIPLHIFSPGLGFFREFVLRRPEFDRLTARYFLPADQVATYRDLLIMSSLGLDCGLDFNGKSIPWDKLSDLAISVIYPKLERGTVEPFNYLLTRFEPTKTIDFNAVYFNDPERYLHLDRNFRIALSNEDLEKGNFIAEGPEALAGIRESDVYKAAISARNRVFISMNDCTTCPAWRICLGKFPDEAKGNKQCRDVFGEVMEAAVIQQERMGNQVSRELCQP